MPDDVEVDAEPARLQEAAGLDEEGQPLVGEDAPEEEQAHGPVRRKPARMRREPEVEGSVRHRPDPVSGEAVECLRLPADVLGEHDEPVGRLDLAAQHMGPERVAVPGMELGVVQDETKRPARRLRNPVAPASQIDWKVQSARESGEGPSAEDRARAIQGRRSNAKPAASRPASRRLSPRKVRTG